MFLIATSILGGFSFVGNLTLVLYDYNLHHNWKQINRFKLNHPSTHIKEIYQSLQAGLSDNTANQVLYIACMQLISARFKLLATSAYKK